MRIEDGIKLPEIRKRWLRTAVGMLLITAALLKAHELATVPLPELGFFSSKNKIHVFVICELFLGIALLSNAVSTWTWTAAVTVFLVFWIVNLVKGIRGLESCGCFGRMEISPWSTLVIDTWVVFFLIFARPSPLNSKDFSIYEIKWVFVVTAIISLPVSIWVFSYEPTTLNADGVLVGDDGFVLLEPEKWIDAQFPLFAHIPNSDGIENGEWVVLLYHYDCPKCQAVLPEYRRMASQNKMQIALVEIPPYGDLETSSDCLEVKLSDDYEWFVTAPVELRLKNGVVVGVLSDIDRFRFGFAMVLNKCCRVQRVDG